MIFLNRKEPRSGKKEPRFWTHNVDSSQRGWRAKDILLVRRTDVYVRLIRMKYFYRTKARLPFSTHPTQRFWWNRAPTENGAFAAHNTMNKLSLEKPTQFSNVWHSQVTFHVKNVWKFIEIRLISRMWIFGFLLPSWRSFSSLLSLFLPIYRSFEVMKVYIYYIRCSRACRLGKNAHFCT